MTSSGANKTVKDEVCDERFTLPSLFACAPPARRADDGALLRRAGRASVDAGPFDVDGDAPRDVVAELGCGLSDER